MTRAAVFTDIAGAIDAARAASDIATGGTLVVNAPNRQLVDYGTQVDPFLQWDLVWRHGEQMELGEEPVVRSDAQLIVSAAVKVGDGTLAAQQLLDFVTPYLELRTLSVARTKAAAPSPFADHNGWHYESVIIYVWYDRFATLT